MAPTIDKILQTVVKVQLEEFIESNKILNKFQSGFRGQHSCETAINFVIMKWKQAIEKNKIVLAVFLDLKRAFETIDRNILLNRLREYGVSGRVLQWFKSWLQERKQRTKYREIISEPHEIDIGVPQGTPLSCLLFNIYINEMPRILSKCSMKLFADDAMIWIEGMENELSYMVDEMNSDLNRLSEHLVMCKLKLNIDKTKYMLIGRKNDMNGNIISVSGNALTQVDNIKYLGIMIDQKLNFKEHLTYTHKKIAKKVYFLGRLRNKMDRSTKLLVYKSLILPHIEYCSSILFLTTDQEIHGLQLLQNKALRHILKRDVYTNIDTMLRQLELLDVKQVIYYNTLKLIYKAEQGKLPDYMSELLVNVSEVQPYNSRSNNLYRLPRNLTSAAQNSLMYKGLNLYNEMKRKYHISENMQKFEEILKEFIKDKISSH